MYMVLKIALENIYKKIPRFSGLTGIIYSETNKVFNDHPMEHSWPDNVRKIINADILS